MNSLDYTEHRDAGGCAAGGAKVSTEGS